jgi:transaldolase
VKLFIDSADINEIKKMKTLGLLGGVTTNPTLIVKHLPRGEDPVAGHRKIIGEIVKAAQVDVLAEPINTDLEGIISESRNLSKINPGLVVAKLPITSDGLTAVTRLSKEGIKTALTLVFTLAQALAAAVAGADYICPFVGRLEDNGKDGIGLIRDTALVYRNYGFKTKIIVASVRNIEHVLESAKIGAYAATLPPNLIYELYGNELTDAGVKKFLEDWLTPQA